MKVYTKLNGKLAVWELETDDPKSAQAAVKETLPADHKTAVLAVVK